MLDLNNPDDARTYIGEMIRAGFPLLDYDEDHEELSDDKALRIAHRFFITAIPPLMRLEPH